jgi:DNA-binding protein HU-beta
VQITGFGSFEVRDRQAREGVKPGTKERVQIPASKAPAFKPGKSLKDQVNA